MKGDTAGQGVVPLRTILRNILNLIDSFETRYKEGLDSYDQEFQELKQFSENLKSDPGYLCKEGEKSVNRKKNRYKDILPFDYTRVILGDYGDIPGSDYINANFIKGASGSSAYIACQGPLPHTVNDFWRMVVECEVQVIVMACNEQESGKHKCENYWVEEEGVEREFGSVTIWLKKSRQVCPDFLVRTMKIRYPNSKGEPEERSVCQFHYSAWPDHGVPLKVRPLLDMVRLIRDCQTSETLPVLVHCSAGCGRTGTICAIDYVWGLLRLGKLTPDFSLFNLVREMRRQRIAMVQTKDQYILVHRAVRELFEEQLKIIDSHPYANVDINGLPIDIRADMEEPVYETVQFVATPPRLSEDQVDAHKKEIVVKSPSPPSDILRLCVQEKYVDSHDRQSEEEKISKLSASGSNSLGSKNASKVQPTSSPSSGSQGGEVTIVNENKSNSDYEQVQDNKRGVIKLESSSSSSSSSKHGGTTSSKSSLLRNPSIVKLKAFFEKSKEDKDKKIFPGLSRAKSDVSSSSRFYTNLASTFTSRGNRNPPAEVKYAETPPAKSVVREKTPVEKIKSKPAILTKPNISVKRSKSLKIIRPLDSSRENVNLISSVSIGSDVPDGASSKPKGMHSSISHTPTTSQQIPAEPHPIKLNVQQVDMPKLQKLISKSVKPESFIATTSHHERDKKAVADSMDIYKPKLDNDNQGKVQPPKKPDVPSKPHLLDKVLTPSSIDAYGTTKIKIGVSLDDSSKEIDKSCYSKMNGKIKKYGTVNSKMLTSAGGGTLLTRSQSHVWQPSKPQVPVRIFSDDNLSQVGTMDSSSGRTSTDEPKKSFDQQDSVWSHRKQSLPVTKVFPSKIEQPLVAPLNSNLEFKNHQEEQQPRSLTLTSHSSFLEARKRVPKTNPYANYSPSNNDNRNYKDTSHLPVTVKVSQEKGGSLLPLSQFHFGESIPLLKNGNGNSSLMRNSSESSSNPGTPRNSLPGTPTQSTDVLYTPISLNASGNFSSGRNQSKSILKGSLSSTPSESDERLDLSRNPFSSSLAQSQVTTNITGPQKISSVRTAVGVRERRNSFRQAVWKEDQRGPKEDEKSENIYITTTSSVPYFVKSSAMPMHHNAPLTTSISSYIPSSAATTTNALDRPPHRDYEPIWPDPSSSTNPFKIGVPDKRINHVDKNNLVVDKSHRVSSSNSSASLGEDKLPPATKMKQNELESQVQDRMAEIKVLLEELKAPGKSDGYMQRLNTSLDGRNSQIPTRKSVEREPQSFSGEKPRSAGSSAAASGLKYHRSLRAPSRPQYQPGFACFTFKKPSSFESITDQVYAEELMTSKSRGNDDSHTSSDSRSKMESSFRDEPYQQAERPVVQNQRLNDYVSLRSCKSSNVPQNSREGRPNQTVPESTSQLHRQHHPALAKCDSTPVPPPRSKRGGTIRRDQSNYVNVIPQHHMFSSSKYGWASAEPTTNGMSDNHSYSNGTMSSMTIRKKDSPVDGESHSYHANGQEDYAKISSSESIPLSNNNNSSATSPKAIIRALGLFQAKAANVRSRFANWSENKERPGSKRTN